MSLAETASTPLMRQYLDVKERYPDCIVFFRLGDFYEMFYEDAEVASRTLDLTLTTRDKQKENPVPMCGVPHHAARQYLGRLVERGFKVAICEQVEDPRQARGIVKRDVVRVVTPGVVLDEEQLDPKRAHYLVAVALDGGGDTAGLAALDVSTGDFCASELPLSALVDELARLQPREILAPPEVRSALEGRIAASWAEPPAGAPADAAQARALLEAVLGPLDELRYPQRDAHLVGGGFPPRRAQPDEPPPRATSSLGRLGLLAAGTAVAYARSTQPGAQLPLYRLRPYELSEHVLIDDASRANLELFHTLHDRSLRGSLLGVLDETRTAMGGRLLRAWIGAPLADVAPIRRRHDAVEHLVENAALRAELRIALDEVRDLERLQGRIQLASATPRDLLALTRSLEALPAIAARLQESLEGNLAPPELLDLGHDFLAELAAELRRTLVDDPPASWREGGFCRRGVLPELDELIDLSDGGKGKILEIEARERERSGISSLKVRYNRVFGYYFEITRANLDRVPADFVRKQTLANAERFVTPELADYEARILTAEERRVAIELDTFDRLRKLAGAEGSRILALAGAIARIDALAALAEVAHLSGYVRPALDTGLGLDIEGGRHPVVEKLVAAGKFVPNDVCIDAGDDQAQLLVITGPNMAGKSTVMRQVALITLMAQAGSFVPAHKARIGLVDRIFTRVGASDNLARGESTFMVEMRETANILRHATRRSLVILDEIGRGTSTYDGLAIAWAVAEHLHDRIGARTLFATHYHELTALARSRRRARNFSTAVREPKNSSSGEVVFLHKLVEGGASRSYGIQVARLAGVDSTVLQRAQKILVSLEKGERPLDDGPPTHRAPSADSPQLSLLESPAPPEAKTIPQRSAVEAALAAVALDETTPLKALQILAELQAMMR